jgi:hypothetical protein
LSQALRSSSLEPTLLLAQALGPLFRFLDLLLKVIQAWSQQHLAF